MEDRKNYFVANIVTKEEMQCKGYMDFIFRHMKERISNEILDIVSDGNEYAIRMLPEQRIEKPDIMTVEVRNGISVKELVRCKDCDHMKTKRFVYADGRIEYYKRCELDNRARSNEYFCADGERRANDE